MRLHRLFFFGIVLFSLLADNNVFGYSGGSSSERVSRARSIFLRAYKEKDKKKRENLIKEFVSMKESAVEYIVSEIEWKNPGYLNLFEEIVPRLKRYAEEPFLYMLGDTSEFKVSVVARWLGLMKSTKAVVPLIILLDDPRVSVRAASAFALGEIGDRTATKYLRKALSDSVPAVRRNAALSIGKLKGKEAIPDLVSLLADSVYSVAYSASYALKSINDPKTVDTLLAILPGSSGVHRYHIIETIGYFADSRALPVLLSLLESSSHIERGIVCEALSYYRGSFRAANALKKSLSDPSPFVRAEAKDALTRLRGN